MGFVSVVNTFLSAGPGTPFHHSWKIFESKRSGRNDIFASSHSPMLDSKTPEKGENYSLLYVALTEVTSQFRTSYVCMTKQNIQHVNFIVTNKIALEQVHLPIIYIYCLWPPHSADPSNGPVGTHGLTHCTVLLAPRTALCSSVGHALHCTPKTYWRRTLVFRSLLGPCHAQETQLDLLAPGFDLTRTQPLQPCGE